MQTSHFVAAAFAAFLAVVQLVGAQQINVLEARSDSQLLLDHDIVHESHGVAFTLHPAEKHPGEPLVRADQPWEGWYASIFAGTVLFDEQEKVFKMWYTCPGDRAYFDAGVTCYAVSRDGLKWDKPPVGTIAAKNGKAHNAVANVLCPSVFKDPADADAARRYKMVCFDPNRGYLAQTSADGLHWTLQGDKPIVPISYVDDVVSAFRDRRTGRYVAFPKQLTPVFGRSRRTIYSSTSPDFRNWCKPEPAFVADRRDDLGSLARVQRVRALLNYPDNFHVMRTEFYGAGGYSAESCAIAFPWTFTISANVAGHTNQDGPIETQIAISRDLETWSRPFRTPVIPPGENGSWDGGMILTASQAIDIGDEVWLYYAGANYTHGAPILYNTAAPDPRPKYATAIGLATWKRDRFASADAPSTGGWLTTVP